MKTTSIKIENGHLTMSGKLNGKQFQTMVDSDSQVIFEIDDIKEKMKRKASFIRELPEDEEYVVFKRRKLNLMGYNF